MYWKISAGERFPLLALSVHLLGHSKVMGWRRACQQITSMRTITLAVLSDFSVLNMVLPDPGDSPRK